MAFLAIVYVYLICEIKRHSSHIRSVSVLKKNNNYKDDFYSGSEVSVSQNGCDTLTEVTYASSSSASASRMTGGKTNYYNTPDNRSLISCGSGLSKSGSRHDDLMKSALERSSHGRNSKRSSEKRRLSARAQILRKERRSVMFCLSIVVLFVATWMPVIVFFVRCLVKNTCENDDQLLFICSCLVSVNSLLDPVLYFIITKDFRNFLCGKVCRNASRRGSYESRRGSGGNYV